MTTPAKAGKSRYKPYNIAAFHKKPKMALNTMRYCGIAEYRPKAKRAEYCTLSLKRSRNNNRRSGAVKYRQIAYGRVRNAKP